MKGDLQMSLSASEDDEPVGEVRADMHPLMMRDLQLNLDASDDETPVSEPKSIPLKRKICR